MSKKATPLGMFVTKYKIRDAFSINDGGWRCGFDSAGNVRTYNNDDNRWFVVVTAAQLIALLTRKGAIPTKTMEASSEEQWDINTSSSAGIKIGCKFIKNEELKRIATASAKITGKALPEGFKPPEYYRKFKSDAGTHLAITKKGDVVLPADEDDDSEVVVLLAKDLDRMAEAAAKVANAKAAWEAAERLLTALPESTKDGNYYINNSSEADGKGIGGLMDHMEENSADVWDFSFGCNLVTLKEVADVHAMSRAARRTAAARK